MPALDTTSPVDLKRLRSAADASMQNMSSACERRLDMLRRMVGPYYAGDDGTNREKRPVNLLELGVDIFQRGLASHQPQAVVQTDYEELLPTAMDFETVLNRRIKKMRLKDSLNICAVEALFTMGVMCVGVAIDGEYDAGCVFAEPVLFPDLILDMNAKSWDQMGYVGHEFLVPLEWLRTNSEMDRTTRDKFVKYCDNKFGSSGRDWERRQSEDFQDLVKLRQFYLPRQKRIVLMATEGVDGALHNSEWEGPDNITGPYYDLSFRRVPGNLFPLAPVPLWYDLDDFANKSYRKAFRQSLRCKTIGLAQSAEDAAAIVDSQDGEIKGVSSPDSVVERTFGGANQNVIAAANMAQKLLVYLGGNWDALAGLAPQSGTVGQDRLLSEGANGRMKDMQQTMTEFETDIVNAIGFWEWSNPVSEERFTKRLEGTQFGIPAVWSPESRKGDFYQINLSSNHYSKANRSPSEQAAFLTDALERIILPSLQFMQPGSPIDWEYFFKMYARYNNAPEINMLLNWPNGEGMPQGLPERPGKPNNTKRTYERVNTQGGARNPLDGAMDQFVESSAQNGQAQVA